MVERIFQIANQKFGHLLQSEKKIEFQLNNKRYTAYAGDTLYSAMLANGIRNVVGPDGGLIALSRQLPFFTSRRSKVRGQSKVLAADYLLHDGDELEIARPPVSFLLTLKRLFSGQQPPVALDWSRNSHFDLPFASSMHMGTVIIGGGISGMMAAIEAAKAGDAVLLIEKEQTLGGICAYYGKAANETEPEILINDLIEQIEKFENIRVLIGAKALDLTGRKILLQHSFLGEEGQRTELSWLHFEKLVIATGGDHHGFILNNHFSAGVFNSREIFHDLWSYGLMPPENSIFYTVENGAYRLAMRLKEAGQTVLKAYDGRNDPDSRHIDFAKAVGVNLGFATALQSVHTSAGKVECQFSPTHVEAHKQVTQMTANSLIVGFAPQSDNQFWIKAGGRSAFDQRSQRLLPDRGPKKVTIVGTAAGYSSQTDCLSNVVEAMSQLGISGMRDGARQQHNTQVYESFADYHHPFPTALSRERTYAMAEGAAIANYRLSIDPLTDQTLRQYFANGYFQEQAHLPSTQSERPAHLSTAIPNAKPFKIRASDGHRLRVGQYIYVAGQKKSDGMLGIIISQVESADTVALCNGALANVGLKISIGRRNNQTSPAEIIGEA